MRFRELELGDTFDWIDDDIPGRYGNSFYQTCTKVSTRAYSYDGVTKNNVGTINARVFHVNKATTTRKDKP